jgi:PhzF family phenazine biosynthesis protein
MQTPESASPARSRPFTQVDVFTGQAYYGNPLAVVLDGEGLTEAQMLRFANWTNLSETTFLLPPTPEAAAKGADYRVRIFTPGGEMRFAGHPTLGTCHAWLQTGAKPRNPKRIVQECAAGLVAIQPVDGKFAFAAPALQRRAPGPMHLAQVAAALGLKSAQVVAAQMLDNGAPWMGILVDDPNTVLQLQPDFFALKQLNADVGVAAFYPEVASSSALIGRSNREARAFGSTAAAPATPQLRQMEVRAFAPASGIAEDPVTGSLNASLAQWLMAEGLAPDQYDAIQGTCLERAGHVSLLRDAEGQVWVGGETVTCIQGHVTL